MTYKTYNSTTLNTPTSDRGGGASQQQDVEILFCEDDYADLPTDVKNAALTILTRLQGVTLHPIDIFTKELVFYVDIKKRLFLTLTTAYTDWNFRELLAFSKGIMSLQEPMSVFNLKGYGNNQKRICLIIKHWAVV